MFSYPQDKEDLGICNPSCLACPRSAWACERKGVSATASWHDLKHNALSSSLLPDFCRVSPYLLCKLVSLPLSCLF